MAQTVMTIQLDTADITAQITRALDAIRLFPPQAVLDAIADCPHGVEVAGDYESVAIRPLLIWQAALDALTAARA